MFQTEELRKVFRFLLAYKDFYGIVYRYREKSGRICESAVKGRNREELNN